VAFSKVVEVYKELNDFLRSLFSQKGFLQLLLGLTWFKILSKLYKKYKKNLKIFGKHF